jgi:hypothetical protein
MYVTYRLDSGPERQLEAEWKNLRGRENDRRVKKALSNQDGKKLQYSFRFVDSMPQAAEESRIDLLGLASGTLKRFFQSHTRTLRRLL